MMWLTERFKKPQRLKPPGLDRGDGNALTAKQSSRLVVGRSLVRDCTCVDTFAGLHLKRSAMEAGIAANSVEERKRRKYAVLAEAHQFEPIAVETMGVHGESTGVNLRAIGRRLVEATREPREANGFRHNLAIAVQRSNAFRILSAGRERFYRVRGVELYPALQFVPGEISSSMRDFNILVLISKFFTFFFFRTIKSPQKKNAIVKPKQAGT